MGNIWLEFLKVILIVLDASVCGILMWNCLIYQVRYDHVLAEWQSMLLGVLSIPIFSLTAVLIGIMIGKI